MVVWGYFFFVGRSRLFVGWVGGSEVGFGVLELVFVFRDRLVVNVEGSFLF